MFVGYYSLYHEHDVYRMLNMENEKIINSHNIIWLDEVYKDCIARKVENHFNDDDDVESKIQLINENQDTLKGGTDL